MVNRKALLQAIERSGLTMNEVSERMGIPVETLDLKSQSVTEFFVSEIESFCEICELSTRMEKAHIFFYALAL